MSELEIYKGMVKKMKDDEIKQLLIQLEYFIDEDYDYYNDFELNQNQTKQLLDYITNLQQENERLKNELEWWKQQCDDLEMQAGVDYE